MLRVVDTFFGCPFKPILLRMPLDSIHWVLLTWREEGGGGRGEGREERKGRGEREGREVGSSTLCWHIFEHNR